MTFSHLNAGIGAPWAGQDIAIADSILASIVIILEITDILGEDPPIGSE